MVEINQPQSMSLIEASERDIRIIRWIYNRIIPWLEKKGIYYSQETRKLQEKLFPTLFNDLSSDVGRAHEKYPKRIHPDNRVAANEISKSLTTVFNRDRKIKNLVNYAEPDQNRNLILIGSPKSTLLTREAMGYQKESEKLGEAPKTDLRFVFNFNKKDLDTCKRRVAGELHEVPNYVIIDRDGVKKFPPPRTDDSDFLIEDYLLLNVMPNNLSKKRNKDIINPSGIHGIGTQAFSLLLKNRDVLKEIDKGRRGSRYYQSIIRVSKVKQTEKYYYPKIIEHISTVHIETEIY